MASVKRLSLKVIARTGTAKSKLERLGDTLDDIHQKTQKLRQNTINIDVDGDEEALAKIKALDAAVNDIDGDIDVDTDLSGLGDGNAVRTSGGYDEREPFADLISKMGNIQSDFSRVADRFDLDERRFNKRVNFPRKLLSRSDDERLSDNEIDFIERHFSGADRVARESSEEAFIDTSFFQERLNDFRGDLNDVLGETEFDAEGDINFDDSRLDVDRTQSPWTFGGGSGGIREKIVETFVGPSDWGTMRGEQAFDPQTFLGTDREGEDFTPEDLIDPETNLSARDIFDFDDRDIGDVFKSEMSFRNYLNPETDVGLSDAMREDRSFSDIAPESRGMRRWFENITDIDMSTFYDNVARLIPMLLTFAGALPAAITGVITLGGAAAAAAGTLAAVGGLSVAAIAYQLGGGDMQAGIEEIRSRLTSRAEQAFAPVLDQFDDLGFDALQGLEKFISRIAEESVAFTEFKDEARDFGEWIFNNVPEAIDDVVALAEAFAPLFGMFGGWLTNTNILGGFVSQTQDALPAILRIIDAFLRMLPVIMEFSQGMLWVTGILFEFWAAIWNALGALGPLAKGLGIVVGGLMVLYTQLTLLNTAMSVFATVVGGRTLTSMWAWITTTRAATLASTYFNMAVMRLAGTSIVRFIASMLGSIPVIGSYITSMGIATVATYALAAAIAATGIGALLIGLGTLGSGFLSASGKIDNATQSLKDFKSERDGLGGGPGVSNPYGPVKSDAQTAVEGQGSGQANVVDNSTTNNVSVEAGSNRKQSMNAQRDLDHALFKKNETSSAPY